MTRVLILGSGPDVRRASAWPRDGVDKIVAINNAWRIRSDWDVAIYPDDFDAMKRPPPMSSKTIITSDEYVPAQNSFGGFVYAGGTMAFTAAYWALYALKPRVIGFIGCDMVYSGAETHFYGKGEADPLREDVTLQSLEAKAARVMLMARAKGCEMLNLSEDESRLVFPRTNFADFTEMAWPAPEGSPAINDILQVERDLGYFVPSGEYWKVADSFDPEKLREIDDMWLAAAGL
jgi:hypothetical protein